MRRMVYLSALLLVSSLLYPQSRYADSLLRIVTAARIDTAKIDLLQRLSIYLSESGEFRRADSVNQAALGMVSGLIGKIPAGESTLYVKLGRQYAAALRNRGLTAEYQGNYARAIDLYMQSLQEEQRLKNKRGVIVCYNSIGNTYSALEDYDKALHFLHLSLKMSEEIKDEKFIEANLDNIALAHTEKKEYEKALDYFNRAFHSIAAKKDTASQVIELVNIGSTRFSMRQYDSALACYNRAIELIRLSGESGSLAFIYISRGHVFEAQGENEKAFEQFMKALEHCERAGARTEQTQALQALGELLYKTGRYAEAAVRYSAALQMAEEKDDWIAKRDCHEGLAKVYRKLNGEGQALAHMKDFVKYRDSIANQNYSRGILRDRIAYDFKKKENEARLVRDKEMAISQMRSQKQRVVLYGAGSVLICILFAVMYIFRSLGRKRRVNAALRLQKQLLETKQREILDSMRYARRIQLSMITSEKYIARSLSKLRGL